ncbi:hypothetical protein OBBRIDRAFT_835682 [Obba rivulosa]|uniref:Uncharacterized protein n=1 Tax=Obba rivulosa TaxID=1052685 RepID=A0A8E2AWI4_9APHY|nr:hypothetical protein OBBRIDRAFT_835682 [Obba rivulosa]
MTVPPDEPEAIPPLAPGVYQGPYLNSLQRLFEGEDLYDTLADYYKDTVLRPGDVDVFGNLVVSGQALLAKRVFEGALALVQFEASKEAGHVAAIQELFMTRWGSTHAPIFRLIYYATFLWPEYRDGQLQIARWLTEKLNISLNTKDVMGDNALYRAIGTHPEYDPEYAQLLSNV